MIRVACGCIRNGLRIATTNRITCRNTTIRIVEAKNSKPIQRPSQRMRVPVGRRLIGHHADGSSMVVIIIGAPRMTVADVELTNGFRIAGGRAILTALGAGIEDRHTIDRHPDGSVDDRRGRGSQCGREWNLPTVGSLKVLWRGHLQIGRRDAGHHRRQNRPGGNSDGTDVGIGPIATHVGCPRLRRSR